MRKRKLAAASETSLFAGIPAMLADLQRVGIKTAIVSPIAKHPSGKCSARRRA